MAKSPIYGRGRNHKRNKGPFHAAAANINMRGKKNKVDRCRCCVCIDMREEIMYRIHMKEMRDYGPYNKD
jgi:hypothetical protein